MFKSIWGLTNAAFQVRVIENCSRCINIGTWQENSTMKTRRQWSFIIYTVQIKIFCVEMSMKEIVAYYSTTVLSSNILNIYIYIYIYILKIWRGREREIQCKASKCHLGQKWHATDTEWMLSTHCICSSSSFTSNAPNPSLNPFRSISTYIETYAC